VNCSLNIIANVEIIAITINCIQDIFILSALENLSITRMCIVKHIAPRNTRTSPRYIPDTPPDELKQRLFQYFMQVYCQAA